ncbi:acyl-CoA acyltransferase [Sulfurimonas sp. HSL-1716]|uniref:acyl-CoA acyltransferase n=1 Tax=Hydrocurvibacter sulfurireducens TaxID=3131937 RepID=UPI0031F96484
MKKIEIRKALSGDSKFLALSMLKSSRAGKRTGIFDLIFDIDNKELLLNKLEQLITSEIKTYCHYSNFLIASIDGEDVGTLCNYEPRIATEELLSKALEKLGVSEENEEHSSMISLCAFQSDKRTWMLDFLVEKDGYSDLVIIKELVKKSLLTASLKGYRIVHTVVEIGSADIMLVYKKLGFKVINEKKCEVFKEKFGRSGVALLEFHL